MYSYINNNYLVQIKEDGTKTRTFGAAPSPIYPESMDVKITNYCDLGCPYCHEDSNKHGLHAVLDSSIFKNLPAGVEVALGGGSVLSHPGLVKFLTELRVIGLIPNITINARHIAPNKELLKELLEDRLIFGLGISYAEGYLNDIISIHNYNTVIHLVAGVHPIEVLDEIAGAITPLKVLVLGYKNFRRGQDFYEVCSREIGDNIYQWYVGVYKYFKSGLTVSFDNLAIEQLNIKRFFTDDGWGNFYMGHDGQFTMYMDLVDKKYSVSSTSKERYDLLPKAEMMFSYIRSISTQVN